MANEIVVTYPTAQTLYFVVYNLVGSVYNGTTFEVPNTSNWQNYVYTMTESNILGRYYGNFPAVPEGTYLTSIYHQEGGSPSSSSDLDVADGSITWSGSAELNINNLYDIFANTINYSGGVFITITFKDINNNPVPFVKFSIIGIGTATTDSTGNSVISLPVGTYDISAVPVSGILWPKTTTTVVSNTTTIVITGSAAILPPPDMDASLCVAYLDLMTFSGTEIANVTITNLPQKIGTKWLLGTKYSINIDESGRFTFPAIPQLAQILVEVPSAQIAKIVTLPALTVYGI